MTDRKIPGVASSFRVRLTHGGDGGQTDVFPRADCRTESLSCVTPEVRAWSEKLGKKRVVSGVQPIAGKPDCPIRSARLRL
jgi:hypothetical protein